MALEAAYRRLWRSLERLREAVDNLQVILADKPVADNVSLVDRFEDAATELQGAVEESLARTAPLISLPAPALLEEARGHLPSQQARVNAMGRTLMLSLAGYDLLQALRRAGREHGGEWNAWSGEAKTAIDRCRQPVLGAAEALLECWQEFAERTRPNGGVVQTTTIHQPIVSPKPAALYFKEMENS